VHVARLGAAMAVGQRPLVDSRADRLAGARDGLEQEPQIRVDQVVLLAADDPVSRCVRKPIVPSPASTAAAASRLRAVVRIDP